jgi:hypothetical protein
VLGPGLPVAPGWCRSVEQCHALEVVGEGDGADPGLGASEAAQARAAQAFAFELRDAFLEAVAEAVATTPGAGLLDRSSALLA